MANAPNTETRRVRILDSVGNVVGWGDCLGQLSHTTIDQRVEPYDLQYVVREDRGALTLFHGSRLMAADRDDLVIELDYPVNGPCTACNGTGSHGGHCCMTVECCGPCDRCDGTGVNQ